MCATLQAWIVNIVHGLDWQPLEAAVIAIDACVEILKSMDGDEITSGRAD